MSHRQHRQILLVEDNKSVARALTILLTLRGHHVRVAQTLDEGFEALNSPHYSPDWIVLDLMLPDGNGVILRSNANRRS